MYPRRTRIPRAILVYYSRSSCARRNKPSANTDGAEHRGCRGIRQRRNVETTKLTYFGYLCARTGGFGIGPLNDATFDKLEFGEIREAIAKCCACELGKQLARSMRPSVKTHVVRKRLDEVRDMRLLIEERSAPPMGGVRDIRRLVEASGLPAPLEPEELATVAETLKATGNLHAWFAGAGDNAPSLHSLRDRLFDLTPIGEAISAWIDPRGCVCDDATPKLASIRGAIEHARKRIRVAVDRLIRQPNFARMLQYAGATFHNDRLVLPLKSEYRGRIEGIVHRTSDSGATLFVEPAESVELNNTIVRLRDDESKELTRILKILSQRVHASEPAIMATLRVVGVLDLLNAKCVYARKRECVIPDIDEHGVLELHDARHPVLLELFERQAETPGEAVKVVPIDLRLGDDFDVLVITGPNTGGKTVALKTIGLMALMTQSGIPIPAGEGSRLPVYRQIFLDIGDEQSLEQSLSTFSSHLQTQLNILRGSGSRSLVLIDELGAGTDPDEGAAIGRAILTELGKLGASAVVTTHLSALKAEAYTNDRVDNASVEFDPETLRPTYRMRLGEPGNSNALIIAKRLGMPARLVQLAKGFLDNRSRDLNQAIAGTLRSRREAEQARKEAREARLEAHQQREQFERDRAQLTRQQEEFDAWTRWVDELQSGDEVVLKPLRRSATVVRVRLQQQRVVVTTGSMDFEVPLRDIADPASAQRDAKPTRDGFCTGSA